MKFYRYYLNGSGSNEEMQAQFLKEDKIRKCWQHRMSGAGDCQN